MALDKFMSVASMTVMGLVVAAAGLLSPVAPRNLNGEVKALLEIKGSLNDPSRVLSEWDPLKVIASDDNLYCHWPMVTCNADSQVDKLELGNQSFSGTLSPAVGKLRSMRNLLLGNNSISGPIPITIGQMEHLEILDLSNNKFDGSIPSTLESLGYLKYLDLSFNNLSGPLPIFHATTVNLKGNPLITPATEELHDFHTSKQVNREDNSDILGGSDRILDILAICLSIVCIVATLIATVLMIYWHCHKHEQANIGDDDVSSAISLSDSGLSEFSVSSLCSIP